MTLDLSKYDFTKTPSDWPLDWCMDSRHLQVVHSLALHCTGNVVEVGCFRGRSTAALVEAINAGAQFTLHIVDIKITDELRRVVSMCSRQDRIVIHETHSISFVMPHCSMFLIDGDHTWPAVLDVLNALASGAECIVMHDTNAHNEGFAQCEGASLAASALMKCPSRSYFHDTKKRPGELTERGLLVSVSDFSSLVEIVDEACAPMME